MKAKNVVTAILLLFVAASVAYLAFREIKGNTRAAGTTGGAVEIKSTATGSVNGATDIGKEAPHRVLVYYFHGNFRCPTCRKIEAYAHEAVASAFAAELESGKLKWEVVNIEEPPNEHFVADYALTTRSLVVVDMKGGKQARWKNLDQIWDLVGEKDTFKRYVEDETRAYLEAREENSVR